jgi:hypothetical protein
MKIMLMLMLFVVTVASADTDLTRLPIGDGALSSQAEQGKVWPCRTEGFGTRRTHGGPWIREDGTFDFQNKPAAGGAVNWPHDLTIRLEGNSRLVEGNALPSHPTAVFPKPATDPTYRYSPNPHPIRAQKVLIELPALPETAASAYCVPLGPVGVLLTGGFVFNALDANGQDAVAHEIQDSCQGHPAQNGSYHYHNMTTCLDDAGTGHSPLMGYAFDGFGIFGKRGEDGQTLTNAELDECHGHEHEISWDGKAVDLYHYHATWEYPYTVGCLRAPSQFRPNRNR